ncbi:1-acyl-sn-glycerol-3-phosphate acyltransferase [bacterium]|nr:1-acyl-sn-glycerol-3-phosphate acyltransferase [bacterium]
MKLFDKEIAVLEEVFRGWKSVLPPEVASHLFGIAKNMSRETLVSAAKRYPNPGREWGFHPYEPFCRTMVGNLVKQMTKITVSGEEHFKNAAQQLVDGSISQIVLLPNHRSYADGNIMTLLADEILESFGEISKELTLIVGPKVFSNPFKACAAMQFNSIKVAQSTTVATKEVSFNLREVANAARIAQEIIRDKIRLLLVFPEGSRSRDRQLKRFLPGVYRMISSHKNTLIIPIGIVGGNILLPIKQSRLEYAEASISFGKPVLMHELQKEHGERSKIAIMDALGKKVAALLPENERGVYR